MQTMQMTLHLLQIHHPKQNPYSIAKSKQWEALVSVNASKTEYMCFKQEGFISTLS